MDAELHAFVSDIVAAHIAAIPRPFEGIVVDGSWNPQYGTITVKNASSAALLAGSAIGPLLLKDVVYLAPAHLTQAGPVGNERCVVFPFHGGWAAHLLHEEDDSPGAPAGEHWIGHKSGSVIKLKNSGDISTTAHAGYNVESVTFAATATENASLTAPSTQIGPSGGPYLNIGGSGAGGTLALVRVFELNTLVAAHNALVTLFNAHTHHGVQGGGDTSGPTSTTATPTAPATGATTATAG